MHGDFSQLTFAPQKRYSSVLRLQGRVDVEADANENTAILLHYMRTLATDLIGPYGGPLANAGFEITVDRDDDELGALWIGFGRYYVDGLLVENHPVPEGLALDYFEQPDARLDREDDALPDELPLLVYLEAREQLVTAVEAPETREIALGSGGPDSAARTKVVWRVVATPFEPGGEERLQLKSEQGSPEEMREELLRRWGDEESGWVRALAGRGTAVLRARAQSGAQDPDPCALSPFARYRGAENQLYRVEVHTGGAAGDEPGPTFKWSRDNGSVVFPVESIKQAQVVVTSLGRDDLLSLEVGQWVEIVDDAYALAGEPAPLYQVEAIDELDRRVTLDRPVRGDVGRDESLHPFLRRWDHVGEASELVDGALALSEGDPRRDDGWIDLEDGVQVQFVAGPYRPGDFWLIPARVESGDVIWPRTIDGSPDGQLPAGPVLHAAPLALIGEEDVVDLRCLFEHLGCAAEAAPPKEPEDPEEPKDPEEPTKPRPRPRPQPKPRPPAKPRRPAGRRTRRDTEPDKPDG